MEKKSIKINPIKSFNHIIGLRYRIQLWSIDVVIESRYDHN